jgi:hypothetical protein
MKQFPNERLFIVLFYTGHGLQVSDTHELCGVDTNGELLPIERWAKKLARYPNVFVFSYFHCCRVPSALRLSDFEKIEEDLI